jgi:hypothetical protein
MAYVWPRHCFPSEKQCRHASVPVRTVLSLPDSSDRNMTECQVLATKGTLIVEAHLQVGVSVRHCTFISTHFINLWRGPRGGQL